MGPPKGRKTVKKTAYCKQCNETHERPVGRKCDRTHGNISNDNSPDQTISESIQSDSESRPMPASEHTDTAATSPMHQVLAKLQHMERAQQQLVDRITRMESETRPMPLPTSSPIRDRVHNYQTDGVVPSLDFLRSSNDIQAEVAARLRTLDEANTYSGKSANLKSGRFRSFDTQVQHYVQWPHEHVYVGAARKTVAYDELTPQQFTLGFIKIIMRQNSNDKQTAMLTYLSKLLQESLDFSWDSSRGAHAIVLQEIERGSVSWENTDEIDNIRKLYTQRVNSNTNDPQKYSSNDPQKYSSNDSKKVVCSHFNNGRCTKNNDHQKDNITFRHICSYCFRVVRKAYNHSELSCNRKAKPDNNKD